MRGISSEANARDLVRDQSNRERSNLYDTRPIGPVHITINNRMHNTVVRNEQQYIYTIVPLHALHHGNKRKIWKQRLLVVQGN